MKALTHDELYDLKLKLADKSDELLAQNKMNLFERVSNAESWIEMMMQHTTRDSKIKLSDSVVTACYDTYIDIPR